MQVTNCGLIKAKRAHIGGKRERLIDRSLYAELQPALSLANPGRCTVECINSSMKAERHVLRASGACKLMHRSVREPGRTIGQLVSDPLFLPALIYSGTTAGENIPAIRVSASSVYVASPLTTPFIPLRCPSG